METKQSFVQSASRAKWATSAKRRRAHAKFRRNLCRILGCPVDSCFSTGELLRDARREAA